MLIVCLTSSCAEKTEEGDKTVDNRQFLTPWHEGVLDIHHISTGRGDATLVIMPDGTNLLIDCGDAATSGATTHNEVLPVLPNASKHAAGWVQNYFKSFAPESVNNTVIDYALLTHYHGDHMGSASEPYAVSLKGYSFKLNGLTELGYYMTINKLINRTDENSSAMPANYKAYIKEWRKVKGLATEVFKTGSNSQIAMLHTPEKYPSFEVRNVVSSRSLWTGVGDGVKSFSAVSEENSNSCGVRISFGKFDYLSTGDLPGSAASQDLENVLSAVVGECDVVQANHHGYQSAMGRTYCKNIDAQVYVVASREYWHPSGDAVKNMCDRSLHSSEPQVYCAGLLPSTRESLSGLGFGGFFKKDGHIVVRVTDGGECFRIYVLNDRSMDREITYVSPIFYSK